MTDCPCGSRREYSACCAPYIAGKPAPTAEALMRSRYSAYTIGNFDYIEKTCTGPAALSFNRAEAERAQLGTEWLGLEIKKTQQGRESDTAGTVKFLFRYRHHGQEFSHLETSNFRRIDGFWLYHDGEFKAAPARPDRAGRNDPCPCGSGKKYKKCCGADL
ncbi:YchJ family protein [Rhizobium sp. KVB221]|uniref:YchJ family protein n=1 Tax=Rhizobium setariae TaxID=2801340 RepID=A0A936YRJ9_9HYPH|nr:YchJ family protein [Rhizobium setariae]MBL0371040.1 YchJ family protein [Rhizobium setariae]